MTHPTAGLDDGVHQRVRLGVLAALSETAEAEFVFLRDALGVTAGNLSRHLDVLVDAGLVTVRKGHVGRRPRTWVSITGPGRAAFATEVASLQALLESVKPSGRADSRSRPATVRPSTA